MIRHVVFMLLSFCSLSATAQTIVGDWLGYLEIQEVKYRLMLHMDYTDNGYVGTMDSPDQGAMGFPMDNIVWNGTKLSFQVPKAGLRYDAQLVGDSLLNGTMTQGSVMLPISFNKFDLTLHRPQTPRPPYPYKVEDVVVYNSKDGVKLTGTLTMPMHGKPSRAVIMLTGSGTQDRNETIFDHKPFWVIADCLTRASIAVLRCDDRGAGGSEGDPNIATTATGASDAEAMIDYLKSRSEIDSTRIGLLGHSEGGAIAFMTAARRSEITFVISMAGPGVKGDSVMVRQNMDMARLEGMSEAKLESLRQMLKQIYAIAESDLSGEEVIEKAASLYESQLSSSQTMTEENRRALRRQMSAFSSPWMRFFLKYDPQEDLAKLHCHVLALNGERDTQVDCKTNLSAIQQALPVVPNRIVTIKSFPELNHLFQHCQTGLFTEYNEIEETISPEVLSFLVSWLTQLP